MSLADTELEQATIETPLGGISCFYDEHYVYRINFDSAPHQIIHPNHQVYQAIETQLRAYFRGHCHALVATPHTLRGYRFPTYCVALFIRHSRRRTRTYGQIARQLNTSPRAIGQACKRNPLPLLIPCHRVVAESSIGGYAGPSLGRMLNIKRWLLHHEYTCWG